MNLEVEYKVEPAYGAVAGGEWLVIGVCKSCKHREIAARFHTELDAKMWALQKNEPKEVA